MGTATCTSFPSRSTLRRKIPILPELCFREICPAVIQTIISSVTPFDFIHHPVTRLAVLNLYSVSYPCAVWGGGTYKYNMYMYRYKHRYICYSIFYIAYKLRKILSTFSGLALQTDWDQHVDVCLGHLGQPWCRATCPVLLTATARTFA